MADCEVYITDDDFFEIARSLENKHAIFYEFWNVGKPHFTTEILTAGISFDKKGNHILFSFNPYFWNSIDNYTRRFVICHEMLHVILNHGVRIRDVGSNARAANVCLDTVINHLLVNRFGFYRPNLKGISEEFLKDMADSCPDQLAKNPQLFAQKPYNDYRDYCWVDTSFNPKIHPEISQTTRGKVPPDDMSYEYYYKILPRKETSDGGGKLAGSDGFKGDSFDCHDGLKDLQDLNEIMKEVNKKLEPEDKEEIKEMINDHFQKQEKGKDSTKKESEQSQMAGTEEGNVWTFEKISARNTCKKPKWETVIKRWVDKRIKYEFKDVEQWPRPHPRLSLFTKGFFIPSEMDIYDLTLEENKIKVWFVIDNSGSCAGLFSRFAKAAFSLPPERFDVRLWCFDTRMHEIIPTKDGVKALGGGGTLFACIEKKIQEVIKNEQIDYPSACFILTDGVDQAIYSKTSMVVPQIPERWHWFLTTDYRDAIPKKCIELKQVYALKDFE